MKKLLTLALCGLFAFGATFALTSCKKDETAGDKVDAAIEAGKEAAEDAAEATEDAAEDAAEAVDDAAKSITGDN